jgi:uncharacterized membrane protein
MTELSRQQAQRRVEQIRAFQRELAGLRADGTLELQPAQAAAVEARHQALLAELSRGFDIDRDEAARQLSTGMKIASFLGALALAASVFFLFRQFWGRFDTPVQVAVLLAAAFGSFLGAMALHRRDPSGYFTRLAAMVAFACFVLDTLMLGEMFNITPSENALLAWAALALLLAYACDLRLLLAVGIACLACFIAARTGTYAGMYWLDTGAWPEHFLLPALLLFWAPTWLDHRRFDGFAAAWRVGAMLFFFLPVLVLSNWGSASYLPMTADAVEVIYQLLGFGAAAGLAWLGVRRGWNEVTNTAVVFFVIQLYTKFYDWWWDLMPKYLFFLVIALVSVLVLTVLRRLRAGHRMEDA